MDKSQVQANFNKSLDQERRDVAEGASTLMADMREFGMIPCELLDVILPGAKWVKVELQSPVPHPHYGWTWEPEIEVSALRYKGGEHAVQ